MIKYSDIKDAINDRLNNNYFTSTKSNEILRATNQMVNDINIGKVSDKPTEFNRLVAYNFQRESSSFSYTTGTNRVDLSTVITDLSNLKWTDSIIVNGDENRTFTKRTASFFRRKRGVNMSSELMFADEHLNGTRSILVYNRESQTLDLIWYSNFMVLNADGVTRQTYFTGNDNETLLLPDMYSNAPFDIIAGYLYRQDRNELSTSTNFLLSSGRQTLQSMIGSIGVREKKPVDGIRMRSEWGGFDSSFSSK